VEVSKVIIPPAEISTDLPEREVQNWNNLFNLKSANEWMEDAGKTPAAKALFGDFWLEGELSILFSDTNRGKSTLAMQIAEALARGKAIAPFETAPEAQKVLYFDFELSGKQFEARYSAAGTDGVRRRYRFSDNLLRAQTALHGELPPGYKDMAEFVQHSFTALLRQTGARIVIVDNITFLKGANENASAAAQLMKTLKYLKDYFGLSVLVLAHMPKLPFTSPLSLRDLQGSKMLSNFADNVFVIGASNQAGDLRYLKHLKPRHAGIRYDVSNVILYRIERSDEFLHFEFVGYANERDHLIWHYEYIDGKRGDLIIAAKRLFASGASRRRVALILGVSHTTVGRYLKAAAPNDEDILSAEDLRRMNEEQE
jgi:AAA domain